MPKASAKASLSVAPDATLSRSQVQTDPVSREQMIAEAAYYLAERRAFEPGHELEDWYAAERDIDESLGRERDKSVCGR